MEFILLAFLLMAALVFGQAQMDECLTQTIDNPIWQQYAGNVTGMMNATMALIPVPYTLARSKIPATYNILSAGYKTLLPNLPDDMYPMLFQSAFDHGIRLGNETIPGLDPTVETAHSVRESTNTLSFQHAFLGWPFVDPLGDGASSFIWVPDVLISAGATLPTSGARAYGDCVYQTLFDPACDAYGAISGGGTAVNATSNDGSGAFFESNWRDTAWSSEWEQLLAFFVNVTNQPSFGNASMCDNQIRLFSTPGSPGVYAARPIVGEVLFYSPLLSLNVTECEVKGVQVGTPFIENNEVSCDSLKGYGGADIPGWITGTGH